MKSLPGLGKTGAKKEIGIPPGAGKTGANNEIRIAPGLGKNEIHAALALAIGAKNCPASFLSFYLSESPCAPAIND